MHMSHDAIVIEGLSKSYQRGRLRNRDLRNSLTSFRKPWGKSHEEFLALDNINLNIQQGDVVGIVGPNGAGKSTLLKLLSRITFPSKGKMTITGSLSSMLEVGTGFHPELTGRENIFLNGAIIGMRKEEVRNKLDSIVDFSGIESFLETPVKHYSSGMYVRLAFSVAAHLEPDILLIDEVLAVGDQEFKRKCLNKLLDVSGQGRTIIMVSHQMAYLKSLCKRGVYLNGGKIIHSGPIDAVIDQYVSEVENVNTIPLASRLDRRGIGTVKVMGMEWRDDRGVKLPSIMSGQSATLRLYLVSDRPDVRNVEVRVDFYDAYGQLWFMCKNSISGNGIEQMSESTFIECHFPKFPLNKNFYYLTTAVYVQNELSDEVINAGAIEVEQGMFYATGRLPPPNRGVLVDYTWKQIEA